MRRGTLLLVESNPSIGGIVELFFRGRGFDVSAASSAPEALALAVAAGVCLEAVVIHHLPGHVDGFDLAKRVVAVSPRRPAMFVTVAPEEIEASVAAMPPWVDAVVPRPFHPRVVCDAMRTIQRRRSAEMAAPTIHVELPHDAEVSTSMQPI